MPKVATSQAVYRAGKWNGRNLKEWVPEVVDDIVEKAHPFQIILFGSLARGEENDDSDVDLLVVMDSIDPVRRMETISKVRRSIEAPVPVSLMVTDREEFERRKDVIGSFHYWPAREGTLVYERS